ncbi:hypothetical protein AB3M75_21970 [Serratia ureilytica]|uniref:hypothetical protein n=1 Tax=Serratia ureilytica TaxID=300181 RepID=UPI00371CED45
MFKHHGAFFNRDYVVNRFHCRDREGYLPFAFSKTHRLTPGGPFRIKLSAGLSQRSAVYFRAVTAVEGAGISPFSQLNVCREFCAVGGRPV